MQKLIPAFEAKIQMDKSLSVQNEADIDLITTSILSNIEKGCVRIRNLRPSKFVINHISELGYHVQNFKDGYNESGLQESGLQISWDDAKEPKPVVKWNGDQSEYTK